MGSPNLPHTCPLATMERFAAGARRAILASEGAHRRWADATAPGPLGWHCTSIEGKRTHYLDSALYPACGQNTLNTTPGSGRFVSVTIVIIMARGGGRRAWRVGQVASSGRRSKMHTSSA